MQALDDKEYIAIDAARASFLKEILRSPKHAITPKEQTPAMALGSMIHHACLEPDKFEQYVVMPEIDKRTKEGKAAFADFEASAQGKKIIKSSDYEVVKGCVDSVWSHPAAKDLLSVGRTELAAVWTDEQTHLLCKAKPDHFREDGILVDLKTTTNASSKSFSKDVYNFKYHLQAAFYLDGVTKVTGLQYEKFYVVAVEKTAPFACAVYELDFGTLEAGRALYREALERYAQCKTLNEWPAYSTEIQPLSIPHWAFNEVDYE